MKAAKFLHRLHAMLQLLRLCTQCSIDGSCCCRDFACAASDRALHAGRLASVDAQSLGFNSSVSAYVQYVKVDEHVQVGAAEALQAQEAASRVETIAWAAMLPVAGAQFPEQQLKLAEQRHTRHHAN